jgi:hypothetical protein
MAALLEIIAEILFEVLLYGTGKVFARVLLPHLGIEPLERQRSTLAWKWLGFTSSKDNRRYLYTESIQVLGLLVWLFVGVMIFVGTQLSQVSR